MSRGGRRRFSGPVQGDAAAEVEEDEVRGGGGGARARERQNPNANLLYGVARTYWR